MGKILDTYNGLTAAEIVAKASNTCTLTVVGSTVNCTDITTSKIKGVIGHYNSSVGSLCSSSNINIYSGFSPVEWYNNSGVAATRVKTPYTMGSFAGYNHNAITPYLVNPTQLSLNSGLALTTYSFDVQVNLSEVNWFINLGLVMCHIVVDGVIKGSFNVETDYTANTLKTISVSVVAPATGQQQTYNIETWFGAVNNKQAQLTVCSNSLQLTVLNPAVFTSLLVVDNQANRDVLTAAENLTTEYVSAIFTDTANKSISSTDLSGNYTVTAELRYNSNGNYSRTINIPLGDLVYCKVKCYKVNNGNTSAVYTINSNYRILYTGGGTSFNFSIPTALKPIADGDNFYLIFDELA